MLTDLELKSLAPELKPYKRSDAGGLYIHVQPNGRKVWRLGYCFDNKQKTLAGGHYPDVRLDARWRAINLASMVRRLEDKRKLIPRMIEGLGRWVPPPKE